MAMLRWEPFREMQDALRRFSPLYLPDNGARDDASTRSWVPLANISESEKEYLIKCELPEHQEGRREDCRGGWCNHHQR